MLGDSRVPNDSTSLPMTAAEIDPAWLTRALEPKHPGVRVSTVSLVDRSEMTNSHARLQIHYDEAAGAPEAMFCKMLPADPKRRELIAQTGMGPREVRFYNQIAPQVELRVPTVYVAQVDDDDEALMELGGSLPTRRPAPSKIWLISTPALPTPSTAAPTRPGFPNRWRATTAR